MKLTLEHLIWIFLFLLCVFFMGLSVGMLSVPMGIVSHLTFIFLLYIRIYRLSHTKNYNISYKTSNRLKEINEEATQKLYEMKK